MIREIAIGGAVTVVLLAAGGMALDYGAERTLDSVLDRTRTAAAGTSVDFGGRHISLIDDRAELEQVSIKRLVDGKTVTLTAARAELSGLIPMLFGLSDRLRMVQFVDVASASPDGQVKLHADGLDLAGIDLSAVAPGGTPAEQARAIDVTALEMHGLSVEGSPSDPTMTISDLAVAGWHKGVLDDLEFRNTKFVDNEPANKGAMTIGSMSLDHLDLGAVLAMGPPPESDATEWVGRLLLDSGIGAFRLGDITLDMAQQGRLSVKGVALTDIARSDGAVTGFKASLDNIVIAIEDLQDAGEAATLKALGYRAVDFSFALGSHYDSAQRSLVLDPVRLTFKDAGTLSANLSLSNLPQTSALNGMALSEAAAAKVTFNSFALTYEDGSLTSRILHLLAQQQGLSDDDFNGQISQTLDLMLGPSDSANLRDAVTGLKAFLRNPGRITLALKPAQPVPLGDIGQQLNGAPESLADSLKLSITVQ